MKLMHSRRKCRQLLEIMTMRHIPSQMLPDVFLRNHFRRMGRQPFNFDTMTILLHRLTKRFGIMDLVIVHKQADCAFRVRWRLMLA